MQRCPKCGFNEGVDWPVMLFILAFGILQIAFILALDFVPHVEKLPYKVCGIAAMVVYASGVIWLSLRRNKSYREYKRLQGNVGSAANPANSH